ncbi:hypothetical protein [Streptomyces sp. enrichment culture]|uniref:hypothetical protein n=1 Tax=Streptomyces sp. enrichment culture TaxID=1795815 RepID=UPI003F563AFF
MTVEHDSFDGGEGLDGGGPDPLMAVITGEPLPDEARADAAFLAAHRTAEADVALLREQLGLLGQALAGPDPRPAPRPAPVPVPVRRRRPFVLGVRVVGVACAVGMVSLLGWLVVRSEDGMGAADGGSSAAGQKSGGEALPDTGGGQDVTGHSAPGYVACARLIVEGDVTAVDPVPGTGHDSITLRVTRYLKPARGQSVISVVMPRDADPRLRVGDHTLIGVPARSAAPDIWSVGAEDVARTRAWITEALPKSRAITCR